MSAVSSHLSLLAALILAAAIASAHGRCLSQLGIFDVRKSYTYNLPKILQTSVLVRSAPPREWRPGCLLA
jgi:hypothetical protein